MRFVGFGYRLGGCSTLSAMLSAVSAMLSAVSAILSAVSAMCPQKPVRCPQCVRSVSAFSKKTVEIERYLVSKDMVLTSVILLSHA
jgi:hypothetical protein